MQYVGRFVSSVYNSITPNINPATLSGAIDVIVVERQVEVEVEEESEWGQKVKKKVMNTELASTPFHVRFGKMSVLRPAERKVTLHLNNSPDPLPFAMKVGEGGEAFFVLELGEDEAKGGIPDDLITSPIISAAASPVVTAEQDDEESPTQIDSELTPEGRHRAPRPFVGEEEYMEPLDLGASRTRTGGYSLSDLESNDASTIRSGATGRSNDTGLTSPSLHGASLGEAEEGNMVSKSELDTGEDQGGSGVFESLENAASKASGAIGAAGRSLMPSIGGISRNSKLEKVVKKERKEGEALDDVPTGAPEEERQEDHSAHTFESEKGAEGMARMQREDDTHPPDDIKDAINEAEELEVQMRNHAQELLKTTMETELKAHGNANSPSPSEMEQRSANLLEESYPAPFGSSQGNSRASTETGPSTQPDHVSFLAGRKLEPIESGVRGVHALNIAQVDSRTIQERIQKKQEKIKSEKESSALGTMEEAEKEKGKVDDADVASKANGRKEDLQYMLDMDGYKMTADGEDLAFAEGNRLANELPLSRRHGGTGRNGHSEVLNHSHLHNESHLSTPEPTDEAGAAASFFVADLDRRQGSFSQETSTEKMQPTLDRSNTDSVLEAKAAAAGVTASRVDSDKIAPIEKLKKPTQTYAKTLRLTSDQLKMLNLRKGANTITFSVTSSFSGVATCTARIFLWDASHKIVVSDIDGTITKSDALGHVFTMIGRDWTHVGVAKLYTDIARNGYRIMYLTSRAIGQADTTRDYLNGISQNNYKLPDGPVIMSPDRLMASLHREVILRKPEVFKMACLRDIARLFGADPRNAIHQPDNRWPGVDKESLAAANGPGAGKLQSPAEGAATNHGDKSEDKAGKQQLKPFYAGFGNRITDALSYRSVNIPSSRIFTIDSNGEVKMELLELAGYKSSYIHMTDLVDQMFPPITLKSSQGNEGKPEFNDFNYWRPEITQFELPPDDELLPLSSPTSPALSARSVRSVKSNASIKSGASATNVSESAIALEEGSGSRLSRFGLGKLGLNRKDSIQTIAAAAPSTPSEEIARKATNGHAVTIPTTRSASDLMDHQNNDHNQTPSSPSSYGSGVTSWAAGWRRRAASPGATSNSSIQATSPLVGPVITAEPEEEEEDADDDVSSLEGDDDDEEEEEDQDSQSGQAGEESIEDDDPLLATGEIRFEWRG